VTILFRVLSEEESRRVTRWKAPELGGDTIEVVSTRQEARPRQPDEQASIRALLGSLDLKPGQQSASPVAPRLQQGNIVDVLAKSSGGTTPGTEEYSAEGVPSDTSLASASMLQSSYDEGYSRGFAEGNAALHQHSVNELRQIIDGLGKACEHDERTDIEHQVVSLSLDIARLVIRHEISTNNKAMHNIVLAGLKQLPGTNQSVRQVYLHPLDANTVRLHLQDDANILVRDDTTLDRGECRIESGASVLNAGVEDWLHTLSEQLASGTLP